ncbi:MAG: hypothetical protein GXP40_02330 [Chloroflexi bacterium]|nr:hypothetical protein [Chloroflexota bacterium]
MNKTRLLLSPIYVFIIISLILSACSLSGKPTQPAATPTAAAPAQPLPPVLVETNPPNGSQIPRQAAITLYFNQPMDRASVESAFGVQPDTSGRFDWLDDATVTFTPDQPFETASSLTLSLSVAARAANGLAFQQPVTVTYTTADYLRSTQFLPVAGAGDVTTNSAVAVSFNQPVVPLGADSSSQPAAFTLKPAAQGRGEWLNTSTYIFYPDPGLAGGVTYMAILNEDLVSTAGAPLDQNPGAVAAWMFTTAVPRLVSTEPSSEQPLPLDGEVTFTFNQPMDAASVESNFAFSGPDGAVAGTFSWSDDRTAFTFQPSNLLSRDTDYTLALSGQAQALGGTSLGGAVRVVMRTFPDFVVSGTTPTEGGTKKEYGSAKIVFSAPVDDTNVDDFVTVSPSVSNFQTSVDETVLYAYGDYAPETQYTLTISSALKDAWGEALGAPFTLHFSTPPATPQLLFPYLGTDVFFTRSDQPSFYVQATNVSTVDMALGEMPLADLFRLLGPDGYDERRNYAPPEVTQWRQTLSLTRNKNEAVPLRLTVAGEALAPGVYYFQAQSPDADRETLPVFLIASNYNLVFKTSATDALVWATDLRTNAPLADTPVYIYDEDGILLTIGQTDSDGVWYGSIPTQEDPYRTCYAVIGQPGEDGFALAVSSWDQGISPWRFDIAMDRRAPHTAVYLYTDRPIYRPGQTVYFRAVVRQAYDGRYGDSGLSSLPLVVSNGWGEDVQTFDLPLSAYGTVHGSFTLPEDARTGYYTFRNDDLDFYTSFQVADYRKPEINLSVQMTPDEIKSGQSLTALVSARYFFDAPAGDLPVHWALYDRSGYFRLPNYRVGELSLGWLAGYSDDFGYFGEPVAEGDAVTDADGALVLSLSDLSLGEGLRNLTLEVTAQDESGQQVSARATALRHPSDFYIGLRPDVWIGQAGTEVGFDVRTVDWAGAPSATRSLHADFQQVTWQRQDPVDPYGSPTFTPVYTPVSSTDFVTGPDGLARLAFTPPQPGTYVLDVGDGVARSQIMLWVGGAEQAIWPNLPDNHLELTADRDAYRPGDTAQIFIPNPLGEETQALVTVERGTVHSSRIIQMAAGGSTFSLPLDAEDAPNVYVSAVLLGEQQFRVGYVALDVEPESQILNVTLTSQPTRSQPGGEVTFGVRVTDVRGNPVQGEFSLSVVDLAALALADPNAPDIVPAFYGEQPIGVRTSLSLAAESIYGVFMPGGLGGGGGGGDGSALVVRDNFPDTAYWNATIVTDAAGLAQVTVTLPDNLTTWQVDVRGLTADTRVGQAEAQVVSTKDVLVRPVTPRFLVVGDHVEMAAILHNNTADDVQGTIALQAIGFLLDDPAQLTQDVSIPAGGRVRVSWWGTAQDADTAELLFSAQLGNYQDVTRPVWGSLPILHYTAPQTFVTAGVLREAGSRLEVISLPRSFLPTGGKLDVELSPSLAAAILDGLDAMPVPAYTGSSEAILSYLLPNLETYRALQAAGLDAPELQARLEGSLDESIRRLVGRQNEDGGWGWWLNGESHPYISTYVLFGLWRAQVAGITVDEDVIQSARDYLIAARPYLEDETLETWQMDRLAFIEYVLQMAGGAETQAVAALYDGRDQLSPWAQALLALTLESRSPGDERARDLLSNLESSAIRSASGAHWESESGTWQNPGTPRYTSAVVVYALAQRDPANPLLGDAVRYLASQRDARGLWGSTYESAWVLLSLTEAMKGAGELNADFAFSAALNGAALAEGQASGPQTLTPVTTSTPLDSLFLAVPNALTVSRQAGIGNLYYRAALSVEQPAELAQPLDQGMTVSREYLPADCDADCAPVQDIRLAADARLTVRLTLTLPHDSYYVMLEDYIPSGSEILDQTLKTSQQGVDATDVSVYAPDDPFARGWGWWLFGAPQISDDHILWAADYLPAGTYVLTYTLIPLQAGEYRVLPAHAWQAYFPEVQGTSAGEVFEIRP